MRVHSAHSPMVSITASGRQVPPPFPPVGEAADARGRSLATNAAALGSSLREIVQNK